MSAINDKSTVPLPWLITGIAVTVSLAAAWVTAYVNIITRLDALQQEQWSSTHMELWVEKARQRQNLPQLPGVEEVKRSK